MWTIAEAGELAQFVAETTEGRAAIDRLEKVKEVDENLDHERVFKRQEAANNTKRITMNRFLDAAKEGLLQAVYFSYSVMNSGRILQTDDLSPQQSHTARHLLRGGKPVEYTTENLFLFKTAVLFNLGYKTDKQTATDIKESYNEWVGHPEILAAVKANLLKDPTARRKALTKAFNDIEAASHIGGDASVISAIAALTKYYVANGSTLEHVPDSAIKPFTSDVPLEIDGIANGTAIGLMQFPHFRDPEQLQLLLELVGVRYKVNGDSKGAAGHLQESALKSEAGLNQYLDIYEYFAREVQKAPYWAFYQGLPSTSRCHYSNVRIMAG